MPKSTTKTDLFLCKKARGGMEQTCAIARAIKERGGRALIVGGFVRDLLARQQSKETEETIVSTDAKDIDLEIFGLTFKQCQRVLERFGEVRVVGKQFCVMNVCGIDVAIPRTESKTTPGHKGFVVKGEPTLSFEHASRRRDFTVNALALDPLMGEILDAHNGRNDLRNKTLRAVDPATFADDPLRPLRAMQLAARLHFGLERKTAELCRTIPLRELPRERIGEEWRKLLLRSEKPSEGLTVARELGILEQLHPELEAIIDIPQHPKYHPEGDVWTHTLLALDAAAHMIADRERANAPLDDDAKLTILLATLTHDLGKATTTRTVDERLVSWGHERAGVPPAMSFLETLNIGKAIRERVSRLIENHLFLLSAGTPTDAAIRRLARRLEPATIEELAIVIAADFAGKGTSEAIQKGREKTDDLLERAKRLETTKGKPKPLIGGRDLMDIGVAPGEEMGRILDTLYERQIEGEVMTREEGLKLAQSMKQNRITST